MGGRDLPERRDVKRVLRDLGMTNRQVDALLRGGWAALVGEASAEADELRDKLAALNSLVSVESNARKA